MLTDNEDNLSFTQTLRKNNQIIKITRITKKELHYEEDHSLRNLRYLWFHRCQRTRQVRPHQFTGNHPSNARVHQVPG